MAAIPSVAMSSVIWFLVSVDALVLASSDTVSRLEKKVEDLAAANTEQWAIIRSLVSEVQELKQTRKLARSLPTKRHYEPPMVVSCPDGFVSHHSSCYKVSSIKATWADAIVYCQAYGAELVRIETKQEHMFLQQYLKQVEALYPSKYFWTSGTDHLVEGEWIWAFTLQPVGNITWAPGEPDRTIGGHEEDCLGLIGINGGKYEFDDYQCTQSWEHFICEVQREEIPGIIG